MKMREVIFNIDLDEEINSWKKLKSLYWLSKLKGFEGTLPEIEGKVGYSTGNPISRRIIKELVRVGAIYPSQMRYSYQLYKVDSNFLAGIIEDLRLFKEIRVENHNYDAYPH